MSGPVPGRGERHVRIAGSYAANVVVSPEVELRSRFAVDDEELSRLHDSAFGSPGTVLPWSDRLARFSVSWVGAFAGLRLVGFVHAVWDGGRHAFLLDAAVHPEHQRQDIGRALVERLVADVRVAGCEWLHVDFEPRLRPFYSACGFRHAEAGLLRIAVG